MVAVVLDRLESPVCSWFPVMFSAALVSSACADLDQRPASPAVEPRIFGLYAVWFEGAGDESREEIDAFLSCLLERSTLNHYWRGEARVEVRGSWALPRPASRIDWSELSEWLTPHVEAGRLPRPGPEETALYLVFGGQPELRVGACGRNDMGLVAGRLSGVGTVGNGFSCWPAGDRLRSETQIAAHEIVETVDRVLGYGTCAGGGACRGRSVCENHCDTFVGLQCPGAPAGTYTGCEGGQVDGWVVQKFSYAGRDPERCDQCTACDFTPTLCPPDRPRCGLEGG